MLRVNNNGENIITIDWLNSEIDDDLIGTNKIWPYLTIHGFLNSELHNEAANLNEVVQFMNDKGYTFICSNVSDQIKDGGQEIIFKFLNAVKEPGVQNSLIGSAATII